MRWPAARLWRPLWAPGHNGRCINISAIQQDKASGFVANRAVRDAGVMNRDDTGGFFAPDRGNVFFKKDLRHIGSTTFHFSTPPVAVSYTHLTLPTN